MACFDRPPLGQISVLVIRACLKGAFTSVPGFDEVAMTDLTTYPRSGDMLVQSNVLEEAFLIRMLSSVVSRRKLSAIPKDFMKLADHMSARI